MDPDQARHLLREMTDRFIEEVGQLPEGQRHHAAVQMANRVAGAALALRFAADLSGEDAEQARLAAVETFADLGYLDRARANWMGARTGGRTAAPPEQSPGPVTGMRLVRVVPWGREVGSDRAGAVVWLTSLEVYEDRVLSHFTRVGGGPARDDSREELESWEMSDDTGQQLKYAGVMTQDSLPFQTGTLMWTPAPAEGTTSLHLTVQTATGPSLITIPLST